VYAIGTDPILEYTTDFKKYSTAHLLQARRGAQGNTVEHYIIRPCPEPGHTAGARMDFAGAVERKDLAGFREADLPGLTLIIVSGRRLKCSAGAPINDEVQALRRSSWARVS
jgi:hypothetical protein